MAELRIRWQRLVDDAGKTCGRCAGTGDEVQEAVDLLRVALAPLNISVIAESSHLGEAEFAQDPLESNRVWVAGKPLEEWLKVQTGQSRCCGPCGDNDCRTVSVAGRDYEVVPKELVVKAGLLAAAELITPSE
ncbi:DUF2703 domain-containing protein [Geomonas subterranea]|uniref:DUF2703 domain-containing protein n=1 Tax=Geomonas subterranea TaxID=2847989 RepID=A0ABX8LE52_9BACT|nr:MULTISPECIES: DUF2703 domain-containing protein [Geomonas]QXE89704.1 DUF2703 domain-containing protein [Geomonas subterranea]QXM08181.1 DUF2703 domain-containing protein [Geomonas subterranea]